MDPVIPVQNWRKGSQWVVLTRKHAEVVVKVDTVFPMFQLYCKRKSLPEFWRDHPVPADNSKEHNCIPDEHYVQTLLADVDNIYYETEYRREWCSSKEKPSPCFLFAKKFTRPAALRLLNTVTFKIFVNVLAFARIFSNVFLSRSPVG
ncbi:putative glycosyl transferase, family 14 [Rosa chinensis]|uniref:Putative glycosyl transferase, family 14 n=1 Tax=Rosa chinensis TaxID=74649 RepID=A0A2P6RP16_ROSCH|nr:putative glycosyl transferase, family 14 [Rosa chinensis]